MRLAFGYAPPLIIAAAVRNGVFDALTTGAQTVDVLSGQTGASQRGLRAILNALVRLRLLKKDRQEKYSLTPESAAFLVKGKQGSLAGSFAMTMQRVIPLWLKLDEVVRTGQPAESRNS